MHGLDFNKTDKDTMKKVYDKKVSHSKSNVSKIYPTNPNVKRPNRSVVKN
jgi:hypothetical protein